MDASIYVASRTYLRGLAEEMSRRNEEIKNRIKGVDSVGSERGLASLDAIAKSEAAEMEGVIGSYRNVFQRRFEGYWSANTAEVIKGLEEIDLKQAGMELRIPCP
jgi:hypothetical protein